MLNVRQLLKNDVTTQNFANSKIAKYHDLSVHDLARAGVNSNTPEASHLVQVTTKNELHRHFVLKKIPETLAQIALILFRKILFTDVGSTGRLGLCIKNVIMNGNSLAHLCKAFISVPQLGGFDGVLQTSGFIPPGKTAGQLEVYNLDSNSGRAESFV